jgi:hypothetical protein
MPSELTPWEAIFDFKADTDAQGCLQGLKVWTADIAVGIADADALPTSEKPSPAAPSTFTAPALFVRSKLA